MAKNRMYLYGKNSVLERLKINPESIRQIFIQDNFRAPQITGFIKSGKIPFKKVGEKELLKIKRADRLQGIVAEVNKYQYASFDELVSKGMDRQLSFIFLDSLNDPHNLGTIIRIAACFGGLALVIPEHGSVEVNETVIHVASGGENFVPVSMVTNLSTALIKAKKAGYWAVGTEVEGGENFNKVSLPFPLCLV
ncbi:MAG: TrmH family RNA methyltransferase, partial [Planctomycetota bacterium]